LTPNQYREEIAALNLSQRAAARIIGIDERTSRKYAKNGVPERSVAFVSKNLKAYAAKLTKDNGEERDA